MYYLIKDNYCTAIIEDVKPMCKDLYFGKSKHFYSLKSSWKTIGDDYYFNDIHILGKSESLKEVKSMYYLEVL